MSLRNPNTYQKHLRVISTVCLSFVSYVWASEIKLFLISSTYRFNCQLMAVLFIRLLSVNEPQLQLWIHYNVMNHDLNKLAVLTDGHIIITYSEATKSQADPSNVDRLVSGSPWPPKSVSVSASDGIGLPPPFCISITSRSAVSGRSSNIGESTNKTFNNCDNSRVAWDLLLMNSKI